MHQLPGLAQLPLILAGVSPAVESLLRSAGVSVVRLESDQLSARALDELPGRIALYDSERPRSNSARASLAKHGFRCIDIKGLTSSPKPGRDVLPVLEDSGESHLLRPEHALDSCLPSAIERVGGVWMRLADYPYPYQSVVISGDVDDAGLPFGFGAAFGVEYNKMAAGLLAERYDVGLPIVLAESLGGVAADLRSRRFRKRFPLLWETDADEFAHWWRIRAQLEVSLRQDGGDLLIDLRGATGAYTPVLELWRGGYAAALPTPAGQYRFHEKGVPFVEAHHRCPVGLTGFGLETSPVSRRAAMMAIAQHSA